MPQKIIKLLKDGTEANQNDKLRKGNVIHLPSETELIATGDLHGHKRNFKKICAYADLANNPKRHVLFQEIIHGGDVDEHDNCISYKVLFDAVRYKLKFPEQVHFIMGNHDTSFINNTDVMKDGKEMNRSMRKAMDLEFKKASEEIKSELRQFLFSQALAIRCENRIWLSHSLPADRLAEKFEPEIFDRQLKVNDTVKPGSAYLLTWGRKHSQHLLDTMALILDIDIFILGHQPQDDGWGQAGDNLIIVGSEHNHGCLLPIDLSKTYTIAELADSIIPLAAIDK